MKHHIRCPNEAAHTEPGQDRATFVIIASRSGTKGFVIHGMHAHAPEGGGPTLIEQIAYEYERDPIGTVHAIGQIIAQIALIVLLLAGGP